MAAHLQLMLWKTVGKAPPVLITDYGWEVGVKDAVKQSHLVLVLEVNLQSSLRSITQMGGAATQPGAPAGS